MSLPSPLAPLVISVGAGSPASAVGADCAYCGGSLGLHAGPDRACVLCTPVLHLDRPRIDEEVRLAWIPEMSQAALICLVRELRCQLWTVGEVAGPSLGDAGCHTLHVAQQALEARTALAAQHLGTDRPSELAQALGLLPPQSYEQRHRKLGGLRVLSTGQFFVGGEDVFPAVLASWCQAQPAEAPGEST